MKTQIILVTEHPDPADSVTRLARILADSGPEYRITDVHQITEHVLVIYKQVGTVDMGLCQDGEYRPTGWFGSKPTDLQQFKPTENARAFNLARERTGQIAEIPGGLLIDQNGLISEQTTYKTFSQHRHTLTRWRARYHQYPGGQVQEETFHLDTSDFFKASGIIRAQISGSLITLERITV